MPMAGRDVAELHEKDDPKLQRHATCNVSKQVFESSHAARV